MSRIPRSKGPAPGHLTAAGCLCTQAEPLRAYEAAHCAAGLLIADEPDAVLISGDLKLLAAWRHFGAAVVDVNESTN